MHLSVNRDEEILSRQAEKLVNDLWNSYRRRMPGEDGYQAMARTAFVVAQLYKRMEFQQQQRDKELTELNSRLDDLLRNLPGLD
jgi:hypothetical protein